MSHDAYGSFGTEKLLRWDLLAGESIGNDGCGLIIKDRHHNVASSDCQQSSAPQLNLHGRSHKTQGQRTCPEHYVKGIKHTSIRCADMKHKSFFCCLMILRFYFEVSTEARTGAVSLSLSHSCIVINRCDNLTF